MSKKLTMKKLLRGCEVGPMQSAGLMQVIPLLSDLEDDSFAAPDDLHVSTKNYGTLEFENSGEKPALIPCHAGYVVKAAAQDHAMAHAGLVKGKDKAEFATAMCIQQTQGGLIKSGDYKLLILPYALREPALVNREKKQYNKLWNAISEFNHGLGLSKVGNLVQFLKSFSKELDHFIAEFEYLPRQVGAIILIDGEVVGFERTPSTRYFRGVWQALIRECYGSHALTVAKAKKERGEALSERRVRLGDSFKSLEDLEDALRELQAREEQEARDTVRDLIDDAFKVESASPLGDYSLETLSNGQFIGQILRGSKDRIPYASLVTSREWTKAKKWQDAPSFSL